MGRWIMEKTLRTLKDFVKSYYSGDFGEIKNFYIIPNEIRNEAIKWIKELRSESFPKDSRENVGWIAKREIANWIAYFFNITSEELKEMK